MKRKVLIVILLLLSLTYSTVSAVNPQASEYLDRYYANIYFEGNGDISIWFEVDATGIMDEIGALSIRLQERSNSSSTWRTIKTYSHTDYSNMLTSNKRLYISNVDYYGIEGYSYRAYVTIWLVKMEWRFTRVAYRNDCCKIVELK